MKRDILITLAVAALTLSSCGIYDKYQSDATIPANAIGADMVGTPAAQVPEAITWREFFTDPLLRQLIDTALVHNTDLNSARIAIKQSEISLQMAKKAILPAAYFSPSGSITNFNSATAKAYNVPLQISWDMGPLGSYTNKKRAANAVVLQNQMREQAVQANLVSAVAQQYFLLQLLDKHLEILVQTEKLWSASLETQKALWENGRVYSTAVNQLEASYLNVKTQIVDAKRNIVSAENSICQLLAITPQHIARNPWGSFALPDITATGISAQLLQRRPDIRLADYAMEEAFYNMQAARAAFYPGFSLTGSVGWTNSGGGVIVDPGKILSSIVGSIAQPIFARGQIKGNLEITKLTQENMRNAYVQTVIDAGNQVNEALADCQAAREKHGYYQHQVKVLQEAYVGTHELMDNGKAIYLEVLTAQESLLNAQLNEALNMYEAASALIGLYIALGGGAK